jgi:hypothetical protein
MPKAPHHFRLVVVVRRLIMPPGPDRASGRRVIDNEWQNASRGMPGTARR